MTANDFSDIKLPIQSLVTWGKTRLTLPLRVVLLRRIYERKKNKTKPLMRGKRIWLTLLFELLFQSKPLYIYLSICLSVCLSVCLSIYLSIIYLSIYLSIYPYVPLGSLLWNELQLWARHKQHYKDGNNDLFSHYSVGFYGENIMRLLSAVSTFL